MEFAALEMWETSIIRTISIEFLRRFTKYIHIDEPPPAVTALQFHSVGKLTELYSRQQKGRSQLLRVHMS